MTIYFNVTDAIGPTPTHGITRTERRLAEELADHPDVSFVVMRNRQMYGIDAEAVRAALVPAASGHPPTVERFGVDPPPARLQGRRVVDIVRAPTRVERRVQLGEIRLRPDSVIVSVGLDWVHGFVEAVAPYVYGGNGRYMGFCYDLIPIDHPEWLFPPDPVGFRRHLGTVVDAVSRMVCISEHTRRDLLRNFPELDPATVDVLRLGADAAVECEQRHHDFAAALFDGAPFAVYCATLDRRKNHQLLYRVAKEWARRGEEGHIVFVGRVGGGVDDLLDCLRNDPHVRGRIAHVTGCDDQHLAALYRRAAVAVYPSLYEGWGLGVTEALAHGTPCVIASGSSLEEAGLGVCDVVHPLRTTAWADIVGERLRSPRELAPVNLPTWKRAAADLVRLVTT